MLDQYIQEQLEKTFQCWRCKEHKKWTEFHKNKKSKNWLNSICKVCKNLEQKQFNRTFKNKEKEKLFIAPRELLTTRHEQPKEDDYWKVGEIVEIWWRAIQAVYDKMNKNSVQL